MFTHRNNKIMFSTPGNKIKELQKIDSAAFCMCCG